MNRPCLFLLLVSLALPLAAQENASPVDAKADAILRESLSLIANTKQLSFRAQILADQVSEGMPRLQRGAEGILKVRRPDRFQVDVLGDTNHRNFWYDGKQLVAYDADQKFYAVHAAPATIDETLREARERLGLDLPLAQLIATDPYATLKQKMRRADYVGLHRVGSVLCHHISITQENVNWQIWIAAAGPALPRKIAIDFKTKPGSPQYVALLSDWNLSPVLADKVFKFVPPAGAQKIEFLLREGK